jgi:hypothetical protein
MKRLLLVTAILFTLFLRSNAQRFRVGITGGVNISDVDGMDQTDNDDDFHKYGFTIGGLVTTQLGPKSSLTMEISFDQKGSSQAPDSTNNNNYYTLQLNYVDVTLLWKRQIHFHINKNPTDKFGFEAGLCFGSLVNYSYTAKSLSYTIPGINTFNGNVVIGLYYNFSQKFFLSGTYSNSFIPVIPHDAFPAGSYGLNYSAWNRGDNLVFQLTLGFVFGNPKDLGESTPVPAATNSEGNN